jgi:hypothetical protein
MAWRTGFSTPVTSECPKGDGASSSSDCGAIPTTLTDILQPSAPRRFYLSARAAEGILRRASRRGRELPRELSMALEGLATTVEPPVLLTMREGKPGGGKGPLLAENESLTLAQGNGQTLFDGPQVRRLTPTECEALMNWPPGWTIVPDWKTRK